MKTPRIALLLQLSLLTLGILGQAAAQDQNSDPIAGLKHSSAERRAQTLERLIQGSRSVPVSQRQELIPHIIACLEHPDVRVRQDAALCLAEFGPQAKEARPALVKRLDDSNTGVRMAAERALGRVIRFDGIPRAPFFAFAGLLLFGLLGAACVHFVPEDKYGRGLLGVAIFCLAMIIFKAIQYTIPNLVELADNQPLYVYLERDFALPFAMIFFVAAAKLLPEESSENQRAVRLLAGLLAVIMILQNLWVFSAPRCYTESAGKWSEGVCLQSTGYTCGAASVATVLRAKGVKDATEQEAAYLSYTIPNRGVTDLGAAMALRARLPNHRVECKRVSLEDLKTVELPCLIPMRFSFWFDHMTVLLRVENGGYVIGDPLKGPEFYSKEKFVKRWYERAVLVQSKKD